MIQLTPTERLEWILVQKEAEVAHHAIKTLLEKYEQFLETTNAEEGALIKSFLDKKTAHEQMNRAYAFGDTVFDALNALGQGNRYHRLLVV